jgi:hypothetical protein
MKTFDISNSPIVSGTTALSISKFNPSRTGAHSSQYSYHEMAIDSVVPVDALTQLRVNVAMLEDLQARMAFMMRDVSEVIGSRRR